MSNAERQFAGCSRDIFHHNVEEDELPFCTQENWQGSVVFLNQEVELMGLPSICDNDTGTGNQLDIIALVNVTWDLIQSQKDKRKKISDQETQVILCQQMLDFKFLFYRYKVSLTFKKSEK